MLVTGPDGNGVGGVSADSREEREEEEEELLKDGRACLFPAVRSFMVAGAARSGRNVSG